MFSGPQVFFSFVLLILVSCKVLHTANSGWTFNGERCHVRCSGWLTALLGKMSDVARREWLRREAKCQRLPGRIDRNVRQNVWNFNETNLYFIQRSALLKISKSSNNIRVSFIDSLFIRSLSILFIYHKIPIIWKPPKNKSPKSQTQISFW